MVKRGPLSGIRVVEWAHYHMGPGAGMFLADMGADVIHVEMPRTGDLMRHFDTLWGVDFSLAEGRNAFTEDLLRNKRSLAIDLSKQRGRDVVHDLVGEADIFLTNIRQSALDKQQMDYATLSARNPRLIYCRGSGYGSRGPFKDAPGNEMMGLARSGLMLGSAHEGDEPVYPTVGLNDRLGSIGMTMGILGALVARERYGIGQLVETSLVGWSVNLQAVGAQIAANTGQDPRPARREDANDPLYNYYQCRDGVWVALGMVIHKELFWPLVVGALGAPELADDPRFATADKREENATELVSLMDGLFRKIDYADWERLATKHDFIASRVNALTDLAGDPQVQANGYIAEQDHPDLGTWKYVTTPLDFSETPVSIRKPAPHVGEDNADVLREWLKMSDEDVASLTEAEVL
jgi:crotonobetainyl-CoA:carnitine CoA-transferase CaiB-like acyl-CoA transferase